MKKYTLEKKAARAFRSGYRRTRNIVVAPAVFNVLSHNQRRDLFFWGELEHRIGIVWALRQKEALQQWLREAFDRFWK
jgi:hypothetical protein